MIMSAASQTQETHNHTTGWKRERTEMQTSHLSQASDYQTFSHKTFHIALMAP